jgi:phosphoglycerol transferase MdoB-like AlkP superfamily enzyme
MFPLAPFFYEVPPLGDQPHLRGSTSVATVISLIILGINFLHVAVHRPRSVVVIFSPLFAYVMGTNLFQVSDSLINLRREYASSTHAISATNTEVGFH